MTSVRISGDFDGRYFVPRPTQAAITAEEVAFVEFEVVGLLEEQGLSYEFNMLRVVQHKPSRRLFWSKDAGCSCPTPFEREWYELVGVGTPRSEVIAYSDDVQPLTTQSMSEFDAAVDAFPAPQDKREHLKRKVRGLLFHEWVMDCAARAANPKEESA